MQESESNNLLTWKDLFYDCIAHWKWFVLSVIVCLAVAFYRIASSNDIYEATASVLIKTEDRNATMRQARDAFSIMGLGGMSSNVHNEMLTLSSPTLMAEVLEKLRLNEVFVTREGLKDIELYKQEPIIVIFGKQSTPHRIVKMDIIINGQSEYELTNFSAGQLESSEKIIVQAGSSVNTPIGEIMITPSQCYTDEMIGKTIHYIRTEPLLMADSYMANLSISLPDREASVINISFVDASPVKATDLIKTLIEVYNKNWVINQNAKIESIAELVNNRISVTIKELNDAENEISSYMSKNLVADFNQASSAYFSQNLEFNKEIMSYRTQVNIAKTMLSSLDNSEYLTLPANSGLTDNAIIAQIQEYNRLVLERDKLMSNTSAGNTVVSDMTKSMQAIRKGVIHSLEGLIDNSNMIVSSLEKQMAASQSKLASAPQEALTLANVQREQKIKEELYLFLLQKKEENDMSQSYDTDNSQVIVAPHSSYLPIKPNKRLIVVVALMVAFVIPVAILLFIVMFDTAVHTKKDLDMLKASYLGEVPQVQGPKKWYSMPEWLKNLFGTKKQDTYTVLVKHNSRNSINEAFRILRTKLDFMNKAKSSKVFVVTSIQPGSGKSFISMNLATSYSLKGSKVLVIDMDLRRATASKYIASAKHAKGIADYLSEPNSDYKDIIIKDALIEGLDVIPVGTIPPNPAELILSDQLSEFISMVRQEYDYIFLDCPPIDIVAESGEIARYADLAIFVVRAGLYEKAMLPEIDELYNKKIFNNMVVVLNGVSEAGHYGHYGHYGRYGSYNYSKYGYYSDQN